MLSPSRFCQIFHGVCPGAIPSTGGTGCTSAKEDVWWSGSYPSSSRCLFQAIFLPHLPTSTAAKLYGLCDDVQEAEEVLVIVAEALPEHQAANHIRNGATQEESGIKRCA